MSIRVWWFLHYCLRMNISADKPEPSSFLRFNYNNKPQVSSLTYNYIFLNQTHWKAKLDGPLSNQIWWKVSLPIPGYWSSRIFKAPSNPNNPMPLWKVKDCRPWKTDIQNTLVLFLSFPSMPAEGWPQSHEAKSIELFLYFESQNSGFQSPPAPQKRLHLTQSCAFILLPVSNSFQLRAFQLDAVYLIINPQWTCLPNPRPTLL